MKVVKNAKPKAGKVQFSAYLPREVVEEGKAVALRTGIPINALIYRGLRQELAWWRSVQEK
jgi:hypothetical protein